MKNTEMKVIAIILSVAIFLTIITSNVVSIASVLLLVKNDGAATTVTTTDTNSVANNTLSNSFSSNDSSTSTVTPVDNSTSSNTVSNNTSSNNSSTADSSANASQSADSSNSSTSTGAIDKEALAMFQKAAKEINENAVAGFSKKNWQTVAQDLHLNQLPSLSDRLSSMIESFMTSEADAEVKVSEKGSDDAKNRMPACNATEATIASVTKKESGSNVIITIVMKDSLNPGLDDTDGVTAMSDDLLYIQYVTDTIESNSFVNALVKELTKGDINYVAFTITATMTKDGKFVEIRHDGDAMIDAAAQTILGEVSGTGGIGFHAKFYDFKY